MPRVVLVLMLSTLTGCYDYLVSSGDWQGRGQSGLLAARRDDGIEVAIRPQRAEAIRSQPHDPPGTVRVQPRERRLKVAGAALLAIGGAAALLGGVMWPSGDASRRGDMTIGGQVMLGIGLTIGSGGVGVLSASALATPGERPLP